MIVREAPREHFGWLVQRAQCVPSPGFWAIEAVDDAGRIHGMVGYDLATRTMVQMHVAFDNVAVMRSLLAPGFEEAFSKGRKVVLAAIPEDNRASRHLVEHLGFCAVHTVQDGWDDGVGLVLYEMRREYCKWLEREAA